MSKGTILWLSVIALGATILGFVIMVVNIASAVANACPDREYCTTTSSGLSYGPGFYTGMLMIVVGSLLHLAPWIGALIRAAKMRSWGWFVVMLLFGTLATLLYGIFGPSDEEMMGRSAYPQYDDPQGYYPHGYAPQVTYSQGYYYPRRENPPQRYYVPGGQPPAGYQPEYPPEYPAEFPQ